VTLAIHHVLRLRFSEPIRELYVQCRLEPRHDGSQSVLSFATRSRPKANFFASLDAMGNQVHSADIPREIGELVIISDSVVEPAKSGLLPDRLSEDDRAAIAKLADGADFWDFMQPTLLTRGGANLRGFVQAQGLDEGPDPMVRLRRLGQALSRMFETAPEGHQPLGIERAVAQARLTAIDGAHIIAALGRAWGIAARVAVGYRPAADRGPDAVQDSGRLPGNGVSTWAEIFIPDSGWIGLDPFGAGVLSGANIRLAAACDHGDLGLTRHVFKGDAAVELTSAVTVGQAEIAEGLEEGAPLRFTALGEDVPKRTRPAHLQAAQQQQQ
jgi:transglutaminase-like putative cysteine protease